MRFLKPETVRKIYRGVLKRNPSQSEISDFILDFARNPDFQGTLSSMIYSEEFRIMIMPDLVRLSTEKFTGRRVFFLHVPKTAGTSVRLALNEALGIPSFNLYPLSTQSLPEKMDSMAFWPYWAGHANISAFPESHEGFTMFRESRSRILSEFRQNQFSTQHHLNPHLISNTRKDEGRGDVSKNRYRDFNAWVLGAAPSIVRWYIPNPDIQRDIPYELTRDHHKAKAGVSQAWVRKVHEMSEIEVTRALEKSLKRFSAAGWLHQPKGIVEAIAKVTGNPNASLSKENEFKKSALYKVETISADCLDALEHVRKRDRIVFKIATDLGILTDELKVDEDEIFHKSLQKLGFKLP